MDVYFFIEPSPTARRRIREGGGGRATDFWPSIPPPIGYKPGIVSGRFHSTRSGRDVTASLHESGVARPAALPRRACRGGAALPAGLPIDRLRHLVAAARPA